MNATDPTRLSSADYEAAAQLRMALRRFLSRSEQITRAHGLTPQRYQLMLLIKAAADQAATVGELSRKLSISQSGITQLVRRAEDLGLIRRQLSARDARVHPLRLTREGERRLAGAVAELGAERAALLSALAEIEQGTDASAIDSRARDRRD